jgi:Xaa-Pro aminopeptidase
MNAATFTERRAALRRVVPAGAILLMGSDDAPRNYVDNVYPFRQDSHFLYYVGINQAGMAALLLEDGREVLYGAPEHPDDLIWHGPHPTLDDHAEAAGFADTAAMERLGADLAELQRGAQDLHFLPPYRAERAFKMAELLGVDPRSVADRVSAELVNAVVRQRSLKSAAEAAEIEDALSVTAEMYAAAWRTAAPGRSEAEVAAALQVAALARGRQQAFNPIVSVRGEVLHNTSYANTLADGDLLLIDSGAESAGFYASDITRTVPVSGTFSARQREIYEVVLAAQEAAIEAASPALSNRDLHFIAARTIASGLTQLGLMQGDVDEAVAAGAHALFFPHGLGHMLGLDVHDMEDLGDVVGYPEGERRSTVFGLNALRLAKPLEPGFVITVEPGIYFIPALIDRWADQGLHRSFICYDELQAYRDFGGIRIEDDVLITEDGARVLGGGIAKSVAAVEEAVRQ